MRDTIEMAREAGLEEMWEFTPGFTKRLQAFEALVRADERKIVMSQPLTKEMWQRFEDEIRADEREACAKVADEYANGLERNYSENIADAIRARGETK